MGDDHRRVCNVASAFAMQVMEGRAQEERTNAAIHAWQNQRQIVAVYKQQSSMTQKDTLG